MQLGPTLHDQLEQLWSEGRSSRGTPEAIAKLEQLLEDFPQTNRAGCAAWELGHQYVRHRDLELARSREAARKYWHLAIDRYSASICEENVVVPTRAKLGLAAWVYRYTDPTKARELLNEVIAEPAEGAASNRTPPALTAARLLENLSSTVSTPHP